MLSKSIRTFWRNRSKGGRARWQNPAIQQGPPEGGAELKKVRLLASAALAVGCLAVFAPAANAGEVCVSLYLQVNDQVVEQNHCIPTP